MTNQPNNTPLTPEELEIQGYIECQDKQIMWLKSRIAELERERDDHGPNGRNVTNQQYQELREHNQTLMVLLEKEVKRRLSEEYTLSGVTLQWRVYREKHNLKIERP